jgi:hypothetical protein
MDIDINIDEYNIIENKYPHYIILIINYLIFKII